MAWSTVSTGLHVSVWAFNNKAFMKRSTRREKRVYVGAYLTGFGGRDSCLKNTDFTNRKAIRITMIYKATELTKH